MGMSGLRHIRSIHIAQFIFALWLITALHVSVSWAANDASLLGPTTSGSTGASSGTDSLNSLQPANPSNLQTTGSAPASQSSDQASLQQTATDQAKLLVQGDVDSSTANTSDTTPAIWYQLGIGLTVVLVTIVVVLLARYDLRHQSAVAKNKHKKRKKT